MEEKLTKEMENTLVEQNLRLVHLVIKRDYPYFKDNEDIFQIGCIGLLQGIRKWRAEKQEYKLTTIAYRYIKNAIGHHVRDTFSNKRKVHNDILYFDHISAISNEGEESVLNYLEASLFHKDMASDLIVKDLVSKLDKKLREIIVLNMFGYTQEEIGKRMNMSQVSISRNQRKALKQMRNMLLEDGTQKTCAK